MDIASGLSALSSALGALKGLAELDRTLDQAEFKLKIATIYTELADARMALSDARESIHQRDGEIARLKAKESSQLPVVSHNGYNFGIAADGRSIGRPFCPVCEKTNGLQIQLTPSIGGGDACPKCKANFRGIPWQLPEEKQPQPKHLPD
jgi:hypothetical protein